MLSELLAKPILVGPILRRLTEQQLVLWWLSPVKCQGKLCCYVDDKEVFNTRFTDDNLTTFNVGEHAVIHLLDVAISLPSETYIEYDLIFTHLDQPQGLADAVCKLAYPEKSRPSFIIQDRINNLLHGSCRNPHHKSSDSLLAGEKLVGELLTDVEQRPALLMMSGDQVYVDHVAGSMLYAIHQVIALLGLNDESFTGDGFSDESLAAQNITKGSELYQFKQQYFQRELLLPKADSARTNLKGSAFKNSKQQAIFTSAYAHNHLMTFAENMAMYFLVWSPTLWQHVELDGCYVPEKYQATYQQELTAMRGFIKGLDKVQRLLAHIPCYMIFDDHDVTDDWNLTAAWEQAAYQNPLAKRIIGNSLFAYWLCQGWGNDPKQFSGDFYQEADLYQQSPNTKQQDAFIDYLLKFSHWQYTLDSHPKLVVLDSRTRRWRSENALDEPSGLMDWEALCELQQELIGHDSILLVSPAPIFGVKVIETIQRMATIIGKPLAVDAENWMAHSGSASTILNIFKHPKTPQHFVILSGDVHYSFVYDVELRFRHHSPQIWQITSSGIKNQFPQPYIGILDRLNRLLYGAYSPLNLFTKRRSMRIKGRKLMIGTDLNSQTTVKAQRLKLGHQRLQPKSGLGYLELSADGSPSFIADLHCDGSKTVFIESNEELMP